MARATVTGYDGDLMRLRVEGTNCAACMEGRGCGMGLIGSGRDRNLQLPAPALRPAIGTSLELHTDHSIIAAAALGYGLPLLGLVAGASLGDWLLSGPSVALLAFGVMGAMGLMARRIARQRFSGAGGCIARATV